ncbi:MAG: hypothetical protein NDP16_05250 [Crenarchaeota archaeon]|nr:hypothetical protein [Thermoproteota archaeon]
MTKNIGMILIVALLIVSIAGNSKLSAFEYRLHDEYLRIDAGTNSGSYPILYASFDDSTEPLFGTTYFNQTKIGNIIISIYLENTTFLPTIVRNLTITIFNNGTESAGVFGISLNVPYFLVAYEYMILENASGVFNSSFEYVTINPVGNVSPGDTLKVYIPLEGVYGKKESGLLVAALYMGGNKLVSWNIEISMFPMFIIEASLMDRVLNITSKNFTMLDVYVKNIFPTSIDICHVKNITLQVSAAPEIKIEPDYEIISELNNTGPTVNKSFKVWVSKVGVFEISVYAMAKLAYLENINKTASFPGEVSIRVLLITTTQKLIIFDEGHYQYYRFASGYMKGVINIASKFGPVLINRGKFVPELADPATTSLIIIPNPQPSTGDPADETTKIFTDDEIIILRDFLENGGALLLMGNYYRYFWPKAKQNGFDAITGKYGIYWIDGDVYDNTSNYGRIYDIRVTNFGNNSVARLMTLNIESVRFSGTALNITNPQGAISVDIYPILLGDNDTFATLGEATEPHVFDGPNVIMAIAAIINKSGRVFACGSSYLFSDYYYFSDNSAFIENIFSWLLATQRLDFIINSKPFVRVGETNHVIVEIINRGVIDIINISLKVTAQTGLKYLNQTQVYLKEKLEPGESWTLRLAFKADTAGDFYVRFVLSASNYPETSKVVFLRFEAAETPALYVAIATVIVVVAIGITLTWKKIKKKTS